nr:MAG TPA: hypothetical protein [Caudoviricetes sp.]
MSDFNILTNKIFYIHVLLINIYSKKICQAKQKSNRDSLE